MDAIFVFLVSFGKALCVVDGTAYFVRDSNPVVLHDVTFYVFLNLHNHEVSLTNKKTLSSSLTFWLCVPVNHTCMYTCRVDIHLKEKKHIHIRTHTHAHIYIHTHIYILFKIS